MARGFLAGLHVSSKDFDTFGTAYEAISGVEDDLLKDFCHDLWEGTPRRKFVYGSKFVSVIDTEEGKRANDDSPSVGKITRQLILNERPNLVQTSVRLDGKCIIGDRYDSRPGIPSALVDTHLGGLALVLPFWEAANKNNGTTNSSHRRVGCFEKPNCVIIGAGGCSLAATMAAQQQHQHLQTVATSTTSVPLNHDDKNFIEHPKFLLDVTAVEPCMEVQDAARTWFGADDGDCNFRLVGGTGQEYLNTATEQNIDILIIDAEDGTACPPKSMQSSEFWVDCVMPRLKDGSAVVGVNAIGFKEEREMLRQTLDHVFACNLDYRVFSIDPPSEALLEGDRHSLLFVVPGRGSDYRLSSSNTHDDCHRTYVSTELVSERDAWIRVVNKRLAMDEFAGL